MASGVDLFTAAPLPQAALVLGPLQRNIERFQAYCDDHRVQLAPHVKTTMCRGVFERQLAAGAWGATVATVAQAQNVAGWGAQRMLIANQLTDPGSLAWFVGQDGPEVCCWVDSLAGVDLLEAAHAAAGSSIPARVLIEIGHRAGRTGCRRMEEALALAERVAGSERVELHGISGFEGTVSAVDAAATRLAVDEFLESMRSVTETVAASGGFDRADPIVTAGGSAYFDRVIEVLGPLSDIGALVVLRSGCYVTHDCGIYDEISPLGSHGSAILEPALEVWAAVLSTPEPGLAIVGLGKRDVSFDAGMPVPVAVRRSGGRLETLVPSELRITALNDQHAYVADPDGRLAVGDAIAVGISHPCTTFDKWREIALVDDERQILDILTTSFSGSYLREAAGRR